MGPDTPIAAGSSSFDLVDRDKLITALGPLEGRSILDLASGRGAYAVALSPRVGEHGRIWAVDLWREGIDALRQQIALCRLGNITALVADVGSAIPIETASVDLCLMATVLHDLVEDGTAAAALAEVRRVVKGGGTLAIVEFKKIDGPPGPPKRIRLGAEEVAARVRPHGFGLRETVDVGPYTYLSTFKKSI